MGFFLYLRERRRWFTLAGLVLALVGAFGNVRPLIFVGGALIALQVLITIWAGVREARAGYRLKAQKERDQSPWEPETK